MGKGREGRVKRWLVIHETNLISGTWVYFPHRSFHYYRWRWLAKLCAYLDSGHFGGGFYVARARLIGRVHLKP